MLLVFFWISQKTTRFNKIFTVILSYELRHDTGTKNFLRYFVTLFVHDVIRCDHLVQKCGTVLKIINAYRATLQRAHNLAQLAYPVKLDNFLSSWWWEDVSDKKKTLTVE